MTNKKKVTLKAMVTKYFLLIATFLVAVLFGILEPKFLNPGNLLNIVSTASLVGTMALGATVIMSVGEMNFGIGAEATLTAAVLGFVLQEKMVTSYILALIMAMVAVLLVGCVNSLVAVKIGVPAFIATLAISKVNDGFVNILTEGKSMFSTNWPKAFTFIGGGSTFGIPNLTIAFIMIVLLMWLLMDKSRLGRHICAVGQNPIACKQVGINVVKIKITAFLICSTLAGIGGILACSKTNNVRSTLGSGIMMDAMSAAMLGATFLRPGRFNVQGTVVAAVLVSLISNGITSTGAPDFIKDVVQGVILIIAVGYIALTREDGLPSVKMG